MFFTLVIIATVLFLLHWWYKENYSYWEKKNVNGPTPIPFFGNFANVLLLRETVPQFGSRMYKEFPDDPIVGVYQGFKPGVVVRDPEFLKQILIKDFPIFQDRGIRVIQDVFNQNLFRTEGDEWRVLRQKLSPIFTAAKLKDMMPLISRCVNDYVDYIDKILEETDDHEMKDLVSKYTLEAIGACAFGVDLQTFTNENNPYCEIGNKILHVSFSRRVRQLLVIFVPSIAKFIHKYLNVTLSDKYVETFFLDLVNKIVREREGKMKQRKDFMDLLIELKEQGKAVRHEEHKSLEIEIDVNLMAAQAIVFYAAGFETSAGTLSFLMYELARNPEIQERAANEVKEVLKKYGGAPTYDAIGQMPYLTACFDETLRKYPVVGQLYRKCSQRYTFPGTNMTIEKGTLCVIPVAGLHSDPKYFANPEVFRPERFLGDNKNNIPSCAYIPFGDGPRNCIGLRFAKVQSMMGMAAFLNKFRVETSPRTPKYFTYSRKSLALSPNGGIWLRICRRN